MATPHSLTECRRPLNNCFKRVCRTTNCVTSIFSTTNSIIPFSSTINHICPFSGSCTCPQIHPQHHLYESCAPLQSAPSTQSTTYLSPTTCHFTIRHPPSLLTRHLTFSKFNYMPNAWPNHSHWLTPQSSSPLWYNHIFQHGSTFWTVKTWRQKGYAAIYAW